MTHSPRPVFLAAVFVLALFTAIPTEPADAQGDDDLQHMVGWSVGDTWVWNKAASAAVAAGTQGEIKYKVVSSEIATNVLWDPAKHSDDWQRHQTWHVKVWANQSANSAEGPVVARTEQDRYYRMDDHAIARIVADNDFLYVENSAANSGMDRIHEMFPPQVEFQFPFAVGDKWRMRVHQKNLNPDNTSCGGEQQPGCNSVANKLDTYEVLGREQVSLRVNGVVQKFDTYKILVVDEFGIESADNPDQKKYDLYWWSPKVCNLVKREEYSAQRVLQYTHTLVSYSCQGRSVPDPSYRIYDQQNFSSIRFHGALSDDPLLKQLEGRDNDGILGGDGPGGFVNNVVDAVPGFGVTAALGGLVALAALAARRRQR